MQEYTTSLFVVAMYQWFTGSPEEANDTIKMAVMLLQQRRVMVA